MAHNPDHVLFQFRSYFGSGYEKFAGIIDLLQVNQSPANAM
ncbi:hypothetical protein OU5_0957 [Pseudomonas mandelii JR-1]|jgi:hypothetical protein|uniref:Uncharacterized protein n=1 Tax=Pseudomonas mandelii JR-1 TaxID=1147786 RepID=A0A024E5X2_9PSED|nr:hypothetical protein OU5_0957 [Pseudomonas mandelii JR-1]